MPGSPDYLGIPDGYYWVQERVNGPWTIGYWDSAFKLWRMCGPSISHGTSVVGRVGPTISQSHHHSTFDEGDVVEVKED